MTVPAALQAALARPASLTIALSGGIDSLTLSAAAASPVQFTRRQQGSNISYPPAGGTPPRSMTPQSWIDALNAAHAAGKIPDIPQSLNRCVFFSLPAFHIAHPC